METPDKSNSLSFSLSIDRHTAQIARYNQASKQDVYNILISDIITQEWAKGGRQSVKSAEH